MYKIKNSQNIWLFQKKIVSLYRESKTNLKRNMKNYEKIYICNSCFYIITIYQ